MFKNVIERAESANGSLWEIGAKNIDGKLISPLMKLVEQKKCVMVVNVAAK